MAWCSGIANSLGHAKEQNPAVFFELSGKDSVSDFQFQ
jgi:hypothetical protein